MSITHTQEALRTSIPPLQSRPQDSKIQTHTTPPRLEHTHSTHETVKRGLLHRVPQSCGQIMVTCAGHVGITHVTSSADSAHAYMQSSGVCIQMHARMLTCMAPACTSRARSTPKRREKDVDSRSSAFLRIMAGDFRAKTACFRASFSRVFQRRALGTAGEVLGMAERDQQGHLAAYTHIKNGLAADLQNFEPHCS